MDPLKTGFLTSEWWALILLCILYALKASVLPQLDDKVFIAVMAYMASREGLKVYAVRKSNGAPKAPPTA